MTFDARPSVEEDCQVIARDIREADRVECAVHGTEPLESLLDGFDLSHPCYTIIDRKDNDIPVAMFGVTDPKVAMPPEVIQMLNIENSMGLCWMLGTDRLSRYPTQVIRQGNFWLDQIHHESKFKRLFNFVHDENLLHLKWLQWCGFKLGEKTFDSSSREYLRYVERTMSYQ